MVRKAILSLGEMTASHSPTLSYRDLELRRSIAMSSIVSSSMSLCSLYGVADGSRSDRTLHEVIFLHPISEECFVNDERLEDPRRLTHGDYVRLGRDCYFRFTHPTEALRLRKARETGALSASTSGLFVDVIIMRYPRIQRCLRTEQAPRAADGRRSSPSCRGEGSP